ncbi:MAG: hypothetical protein IT431_11085 [Phycisphaerales bacterium]|nr:hypothetical protein [Phycisphaerales bacterium]
MLHTTRIMFAGCAVALGAAAASGQSLAIGWWTIDGGGGVGSGPTLSLAGTIGQPDAGLLAGQTLTLRGGFWMEPAPAPCPADFNADGLVDTRDFLAFLNAWAAGDGRADANGDGVIDSRDVIAYLNLWAAGCA